MKNVKIFLVLLFLTMPLYAVTVHITGESVFYNTINQNLSTNSADYQLWQMSSLDNTFLYFSLQGLKDIDNRFRVNFNTDFSYYSLSLSMGYMTYKKSLTVFYKDRLLDFNDGLELFHPVPNNFYRTVRFYQIPVKKQAKWGYHFQGIYFEKNFGPISEKFFFISPYDFSFSNDQYSVGNKTTWQYNVWQFSANVLYKQQNFALPKVNSSFWAEVDGVWYELNTNSFYKPNHSDYTILSTGEGSVSFQPITIWFEAGLNKKSGGYRFESTMRATSSGNVSDNSIWKSTEQNLLVAGAGLVLQMNSLLIEPMYQFQAGWETQYKTEIITNHPIFHNVILKAQWNNDDMQAQMKLWYGETKSDILSGFFLDEYNFGDVFPLECYKQIGGQLYSQLNFSFIKIFPVVEYRNYALTNVLFNTIESKLGIFIPLLNKLESYWQVRYKMYNEMTAHSFFNLFAELKYQIHSFIELALDYGVDPRLNYDKDYGFEYALQKEVNANKQSDVMQTIYVAEHNLAFNHFITLRASLRF